ncbi:alpha-amylase family glycosyl hydrolase [Bacillus carboniphilus]|uniref:Alpha-amylase family glycosyl hydrolase n=1 Tax=Bacillus carboniphilus TaxID=86663 RepID=A0ABN0VRY4_9BACI
MNSWWKKAVFYEIYMPSFADGNGDGIGDFKGIISKLDYLKELGVKGVWLTPFYPSPKVDNGYDIADYKNIDPDYGTMEDFEEFIEEAHKRGIRVIADLVLNHTSSEHPWFKESRSSKDNPKRDWYIWKDGEKDVPPNNWESFFGGTAWEWDEQTGQYYYHAFAKEQVDLNWANPEVREAMKDVMKFWIDKGIDGFRLDVINFLTVSNEFKDNPYLENDEQDHLYDKDQDGVLEAVQEISAFAKSHGDIFLVGEVGSEDLEVLKPYCGEGKLDVVFNFNLGSQSSFSVDTIFSEISKMEENYTEDQWPTLFFSSHDMPRHCERLAGGIDPELRAKHLAVLLTTAKGVPFLYFGDEIGMRNLVAEKKEDIQDIQGRTAYELAVRDGKTEVEALAIGNEKSRDASRSPMQWDDSENAGFSSGTPWIRVHPSYRDINVKVEETDPHSMLHFYKKLLKIRNSVSALQNGCYEKIERRGDALFYSRTDDQSTMYVGINYGAEKVTLPDWFDEAVPCSVQLVEEENTGYLAGQDCQIRVDHRGSE